VGLFRKIKGYCELFGSSAWDIVILTKVGYPRHHRHLELAHHHAIFSPDPLSPKSSGLTLLLPKSWVSRLSSPTTCPGQGIAVTLSLSGSRPLKIIGVYAPSGVHSSSHHPSTVALVNFLRTEHTVAERLNQSVLILDDFNAVLNLSINRRNSSLIGIHLLSKGDLWSAYHTD
jgi:hypothetical protein